MKNQTHPLQTKSWAEFRKNWGNEILKTKYGYLTLHKLPLTKHKVGLFIKGPMPTKQMVEYLKKLRTKENLVYIKLEPNYVVKKGDIKCANKNKTVNMLKKHGAVSGKTLFTPTTFWIDLTKTEEELMASFSSKTRYNIRLAQKHGVKVKIDNSQKAFDRYLQLTKETVQRQGFYAHSKKYHQLMWKHLKKAKIAHLLTATYKDEVITTWILFENDGVLYYPYGASSIKHKKVMTNNLMMWEAIKFGKKLGDHTFDLWGREEGKGFTRFKEGYCPEVIEFIGTWDLVINKPLYTIYRLAEMIRWPLLRLKTKFIKPSF